MQEVRAEYKHDKLEFLKQRCYAIDFAGIMQEKNISKEVTVSSSVHQPTYTAEQHAAEAAAAHSHSCRH